MYFKSVTAKYKKIKKDTEQQSKEFLDQLKSVIQSNHSQVETLEKQHNEIVQKSEENAAIKAKFTVFQDEIIKLQTENEIQAFQIVSLKEQLEEEKLKENETPDTALSTIQLSPRTIQLSPRKHINVEKVMPPPVSTVSGITRVLRQKKSEAKTASGSSYIPYSPVKNDRIQLKDRLISNYTFGNK